MNGYGDIAANDEAEKQIYVFCLTYVPYTLQEDVKLDRNKLSSGTWGVLLSKNYKMIQSL